MSGGAKLKKWTECAREALRLQWPLVVCVLAAFGVSLAYMFVAHDRAGTLGFPIDDSYIYLTYAKQIGRLEPMTYYPGGPYSAGATSPLWPFVLAPFWSIGFRGYAFVYAAFFVSAAFVAATTALVFRLTETITNRWFAVPAACAALLSGTFTYGSLAAMEVGLAATMLLWVVLRLIRERDRPAPSRTALVLLALTSLTRPELTVLIAGFVVLRCAASLALKRPRLALRWLAPLALPLLWVVTNKLIAGNFFPNTGVAKSHFYQPSFTLEYYFDLLPRLFGDMFKGLFWSVKSPLWHSKLVGLLSVLGLVRLAMWAKRERQYWPALMLAGAPIALIGAVIGASGAWNFHNYRYISAAFPWLAVLTALGLALPAVWLDSRARWKWPLRLAPLAVAGLIAALSLGELTANMRYFAQGVRDTNDQVVKIGHFIRDGLPPDAHVAFHDAGAIAYYGNGRVTDILGLVTNRYARHANAGPGTRFENLEHIDPNQRPTHFAYYRGWLGTMAVFDKTVLRTPLRRSTYSGKPRLVGGGNMEVMKARWDAMGSGHEPCDAQPGWKVVDRVDIADRRSEAAHDYRADLGKRRYRDPTAKWSDARTAPCGARRSITDGGRVQRGPGGERFRVSVDPDRPVRLIVRTGGTDHPKSKTSKVGPTVSVAVDGVKVGDIVVSGTSQRLRDDVLEIPASSFSRERVEIEMSVKPHRPYRSFQYFVLQPE